MIPGYPTLKQVEEFNKDTMWHLMQCDKCHKGLGMSNKEIKERMYCPECSGKIRSGE